ncbi:MAG: hypothetical protein JNL50_13585 [Phycisphaerae bacterium]|nr:hypothetical protein [Phycisphaerae bacterium]
MSMTEHEQHKVLDSRAIASGTRDAEAELSALRAQEIAVGERIAHATADHARAVQAAISAKVAHDLARSQFHDTDDERKAADQAVAQAGADGESRQKRAQAAWDSARSRLAMLGVEFKSLGADAALLDAEVLRRVEASITIDLGLDVAETFRALELAVAANVRARQEAEMRGRQSDQFRDAMMRTERDAQSARLVAQTAADHLAALNREIDTTRSKARELDRRIRAVRA